jgi:hypothetical protein
LFDFLFRTQKQKKTTTKQTKIKTKIKTKQKQSKNKTDTKHIGEATYSFIQHTWKSKHPRKLTDLEKQHLLEKIHNSLYNVSATEFSYANFAQEIRKFPTPLLTWDESEKSLFESFLYRPLFRKKWRKVSKFMKTRTSYELIDFYYHWKAALKPNYMPAMNELWRSHPLCAKFMQQQRYNMFAQMDSEDSEGENEEESHESLTTLLQEERQTTQGQPQPLSNENLRKQMKNTPNDKAEPSLLDTLLDLSEPTKQPQYQRANSLFLSSNSLNLTNHNTSANNVNNINNLASEFEQPLVPESPHHNAANLFSSGASILNSPSQWQSPFLKDDSHFVNEQQQQNQQQIQQTQQPPQKVLRTSSNLFAKFRSPTHRQRQNLYFEISVLADIDESQQ